MTVSLTSLYRAKLDVAVRKSQSFPLRAGSTVSSFKAHVECAFILLLCHTAVPDSKTVLSGRVDNVDLSVCFVKCVFVRDERKTHISDRITVFTTLKSA